MLRSQNFTRIVDSNRAPIDQMKDCRGGYREGRCERRELDGLTVILRNSANDEPFLSYIASEREQQTTSHRHDLSRLLDWVDEYLKNGVGSTNQQNPLEPKTPLNKDRPNEQVAEYLSCLGLDEQLHTYFTRFPGPFPEELAQASEGSQVNVYDSELSRASGSNRCLAPGLKLNLFRLAQRIRDEHGTVRMGSPSYCFRSFEDIKQLEANIEALDEVPFMLQCIAMKTVDERHAHEMYSRTRNHSQLAALDDGLKLCGEEARRLLIRCYVLQFLTIQSINESYKPGTKPTWPQVKKYMRSTGYVGSKPSGRRGILFGAKIPENELDDALNCVLNTLARICKTDSFETGVTSHSIAFITHCLERGATLFFKDINEKLSSLEALIEVAAAGPRDFLLPSFSKYLCCHLKYDNTAPRVYRLASLSCLAGRNIHAPVEKLDLPNYLRSFVKVHQKLQSLR